MCRFHPYNNIHCTINTHCHSTLALEICFCYCCIYVGQQRAKAFNSAHCVRLFIIIIRIAIEGASSPLLRTSKRVWTESDLYTYITFTYFTWLVCMNWNEKASNRRQQQQKTNFFQWTTRREKSKRQNVWRYIESDVEFLLRKSLHVLENMRLCRSAFEFPSELGDSVCVYICIAADLGKE